MAVVAAAALAAAVAAIVAVAAGRNLIKPIRRNMLAANRLEMSALAPLRDPPARNNQVLYDPSPTVESERVRHCVRH